MKLRLDKPLLLLFLTILLLPTVSTGQVKLVSATLSNSSRAGENSVQSQKIIDAASADSIRDKQVAEKSAQGNLTEAFHGGGLATQSSSLTSFVSLDPGSASFSRHMMSTDFTQSWIPMHQIEAIDPTTIFRPSDAMAVIVITVTTTVSTTQVEFNWFYRSDSNNSWIQIPWQRGWYFTLYVAHTDDYAAYLNISGWWPGYHYPRAYKVDVDVNNSTLPSFSEFFEVTNGGVISPRMSESIDANGFPVNMKSRFTIGNDAKAYHCLIFDKTAYFNDELGSGHNFTVVWIQPNGNAYKAYNGTFADYKSANETWNCWDSRNTLDDYISINASTPVGDWTVRVYLDWYFNNTWMRYGPVATTPFIVGNAPVADWTFMVYLDADNNLETAGIDIFDKMASVGSTSQVNIVVQMDRISGYDSRYDDWTDTKRFYVTKGMAPTWDNSVLDLGEKDMGDPSTLRDFVNWTIVNYPANYYFLALWDHGTGIVGICYDFTDGYDSLSLSELSQALSGLPVTLDVVFSDACDLNMAEIAYQIKDYANVLVGPEGLGYSPAPYDSYLRRLVSDPSILPSAFASGLVTDYMNWANPLPTSQVPNATMSAVDLTKISNLTAAIDDFALKLNDSVTPAYLSSLIASHNQIILARNLTQGFPGPYAGDLGYYIDLYSFAQLISQSAVSGELRAAASQVMTSLSIGNVILTETNKNLPNTHGLAISFPDNETKYDFISYGSVAFAVDTLWGAFLKYYLSGCILTIKTTYPNLSLKINQTSFTTDTQQEIHVFVFPGSYNVNVTTPFFIGAGSRGVFVRWNDYVAYSSRAIMVAGSITYTAYYQTQHEVTFFQSGIGADSADNATIIDGNGYKAVSLPLSFWWNESSIHSFVFQTPVTINPNVNRYVWNSTSGLSSLRSDSVTISMPGNITGNYEAQFYLTLATNVLGAQAPLGEGWYYNGTKFSISASETIDETPGASRYRFANWTADDVNEVSSLLLISTTVRMTKALHLTANYVEQYCLTVRTDPAGISPQPIVSPGGPWYDVGTLVNCTALKISGRDFDHWIVDGTNWATGINPITVTMDQPHEASASYVRERTWLEILLGTDVLQVLVGLLGTALTVAFVGVEWARTRKRRGVTRALLNEVDDIYRRLKTDRKQCEEELYRIRNTILEGYLTDGKITQENYDVIDKRIDKYMDELRKTEKKE